jgi:hypothetical protein
MRTRTLLAVASLSLAVPLALAGCGDDSDTGGPSTTATTATTPTATAPAPTVSTTAPPPVATPDLTGLDPADAALLEGYPGWTALTTPPASDLRSLGSAHPGDKAIYAGPAAIDATNPYPQGTVVVKEARTGDELTLIAIMEKVRPNDAATGGWRYVEYTRSSGGQFSKVGLPESGCAGCHAAAKETDWVFYSPGG